MMNNFPNYSDFNDSLVAFIDVLGFGQRVRSINNESSFSYVGDLLYTMKLIADNCSDDKEVFAGFRLTAISDSIIISIPFSDSICTVGMLTLLHNIQYELLATDFKALLRGYITRGPIYHENGIVFGAGYHDSYKGEQKMGGAPRIVLDPKIVKDAKRIVDTQGKPSGSTPLDYLREDITHDEYFIDYLNPIGTQKNIPKHQLLEERKTINKFIQESMESNIKNENIYKKYEWLKKYFDSTKVYF